MTAAQAPIEILHPGVLAGVRLVVVGGGEVVAARCVELGAVVERLDVDPDGDAPAFDGERPGAIVCDGAGMFARAGGGIVGLRAALDGCWMAVQPIVAEHLAADDRPGGRIILCAPPPGAQHAAATADGLENLARTLSTEWARLRITTSAIRPAVHTQPAAVAELVAFLLSPAGGYYSGCAFTLRG